jgi:hypothetical protein
MLWIAGDGENVYLVNAESAGEAAGAIAQHAGVAAAAIGVSEPFDPPGPGEVVELNPPAGPPSIKDERGPQ